MPADRGQHRHQGPAELPLLQGRQQVNDLSLGEFQVAPQDGTHQRLQRHVRCLVLGAAACGFDNEFGLLFARKNAGPVGKLLVALFVPVELEGLRPSGALDCFVDYCFHAGVARAHLQPPISGTRRKKRISLPGCSSTTSSSDPTAAPSMSTKMPFCSKVRTAVSN